MWILFRVFFYMELISRWSFLYEYVQRGGDVSTLYWLVIRIMYFGEWIWFSLLHHYCIVLDIIERHHVFVSYYEIVVLIWFCDPVFHMGEISYYYSIHQGLLLWHPLIDGMIIIIIIIESDLIRIWVADQVYICIQLWNFVSYSSLSIASSLTQYVPFFLFFFIRWCLYGLFGLLMV